MFVGDGAPYEAQIGVGVPARAGTLVFPGANLAARVLLDRPDDPTIDWLAVLAAPKRAPGFTS